jgi:hypothetical protein
MPVSTPSPASEPVTYFEDIKVSGNGDKVPKFTKPENLAALVTFKFSGRGNFAVWSISEDGTRNDLLVNTIDAYNGTVLFDLNSNSVAFSVESSGKWTGVIKSVDKARRWSSVVVTSGSGDDVLLLENPTIGLKTIQIMNAGRGNFAVWSYTADGSADLLVNEIGNYSGEVLVADQTVLLAIESDSNWALSPPY